MHIGKTIATAAATAAFLVLSAGSAFAVTAHATGSVNVRTGPGVGYNKVDTLHSGETVDVQQCKNGWCYVEHSGPDGWVSANYLSQGGNSGGNWGGNSGGSWGGNSGSNSSDPDIGFSFGFGSNGSHFGFSIGNAPQNWPQSRACFYTGTNFTGQSFCVDQGRSMRFVGPAWNDRISSVRIIGDVSVTMCQHANYGGFCRTTSRNEPALGPWLNDEISAIRVN